MTNKTKNYLIPLSSMQKLFLDFDNRGMFLRLPKVQY